MTEEKQTQEQGRSRHSDAWQEVGERFKAFGDSLTAAIEQSWQDERTREKLRELESGLKTMAEQVGQAVDETAKSPEGRQVREEFEQAARSARDATRKAWEEARPQMLSALETLDNELHKLMGDLRSSEPSEDETH
jgi:uncharacterized membrane protein YccC